MDPSPLLNSDMKNIRLEFKKLLNKLQEKLVEDLDEEEENMEGLLDHIQKLHDGFTLDNKRLRNAHNTLEDSMDTRQDVKHKLNVCGGRGDLASLEKKMLVLSEVDLNTQICGGPGLDYCLGCGGALCGLDLGKRKCGGLNCDGLVPISQKTAETAEREKEQLITLLSSLEESKKKISDVQQTAQDTQDQARDLQDWINTNMDIFIKEKKKTQELTQQVRAYLMDEMVPAENINKLSQAVLTILLPQSLDQIQSMINDISNLLSNATNLQDNLKNLEEHTRATQDLLQKAQELREQSKATDVTDISIEALEAEEGRDKAINELESTVRDKNTTTDHIKDIKDKLQQIELKLNNYPPEDLQNNIEALRTKTDQNRETAIYVRQAAESVLNTAVNVEMDLNAVMQQCDVLKQRQTFQDKTAERLKNIMDEVEDMKTQVEDKFTHILGLEQRIQQLISRKQQKSDEVTSLLETVESLQQEISIRAEGFAKCTS